MARYPLNPDITDIQLSLGVSRPMAQKIHRYLTSNEGCAYKPNARTKHLIEGDYGGYLLKLGIQPLSFNLMTSQLNKALGYTDQHTFTTADLARVLHLIDIAKHCLDTK